VRCVRVTVSTTSTTTSFNLTSGQTTASLDLGKLPAGATTFTAAAYNLVCSSVTTSTVPDWVGAPVSATVRPGINPAITIKLLPNVSSTVGVDFKLPVASLATARYTSYAVLTDGTVRVWGQSTVGSLGDGQWNSPNVSVATTATVLSGVKQLFGSPFGGASYCYVNNTTDVLCWGYNEYGQLGDGTTNARYTPVTVSSNATAASIGNGSTCLLENDRSVRCAGLNSSGQLGRGTTTNATTFADISVSNQAFVEVAAGASTVCARRDDNLLYCWGSNAYGQIGNGTSGTNVLTPVSLDLSGVVELAAGESHFCGRKADGTVWCWGRNFSGQLGDGTTTNRTTAVKVTGISTAVEIAASYGTTCARLADETVKCWGMDSYGQTGSGTGIDQLTPVTVRGLTGALSIEMGWLHACARTNSGDIKCWGYGSQGQLGDGLTQSAPTPTTVVF